MSAKISRHLERLRAWIGSGLGHERVSAITARELYFTEGPFPEVKWRALR
ncbi:hypothetical protein ACTMTI_03560 [Nonomuraea sp. H19]